MAKKIHIPKCGLKSKKICLTIGGGKAGFITVNCTGMCVDRQIWEIAENRLQAALVILSFCRADSSIHRQA